jgi:SAM-dependent methyltransferase
MNPYLRSLLLLTARRAIASYSICRLGLIQNKSKWLEYHKATVVKDSAIQCYSLLNLSNGAGLSSPFVMCSQSRETGLVFLLMRQDKLAEKLFEEKNFSEVVDSGEPEKRWQRMHHILAAGLGEIHDKVVLDCGCGAGEDSAIIASLGNSVVGTDISISALRKAKANSERYAQVVDFIEADSEFLPFRRDVFDICYCSWTLHHFPDLRGVANQLTRVLKNGGRAIIIEPNGFNPIVRISELIENSVRSWLIRTGVDTPNETMHTPLTYLNTLRSEGFLEVRITPLFDLGLPPLPPNSILLRCMVFTRKVLQVWAWIFLPSLFKGPDVIVSGVRSL